VCSSCLIGRRRRGCRAWWHWAVSSWTLRAALGVAAFDSSCPLTLRVAHLLAHGRRSSTKRSLSHPGPTNTNRSTSHRYNLRVARLWQSRSALFSPHPPPRRTGRVGVSGIPGEHLLLPWSAQNAASARPDPARIRLVPQRCLGRSMTSISQASAARCLTPTRLNNCLVIRTKAPPVMKTKAPLVVAPLEDLEPAPGAPNLAPIMTILAHVAYQNFHPFIRLSFADAKSSPTPMFLSKAPIPVCASFHPPSTLVIGVSV
jgi:hypothetical protein